MENHYLVYTQGPPGMTPLRLFTSAAAALDFARSMAEPGAPGPGEAVVCVRPFVDGRPGNEEIVGRAARVMEVNGVYERLPPETPPPEAPPPETQEQPPDKARQARPAKS